MTVRLFLGVAVVANILVSIMCTGRTAIASASSSASATSQGSSYSSASATSHSTSQSSSYSSASATSHATSQGSSYSSTSATSQGSWTRPKKCRRVKKCPRNEEFSFCPQSIQRAQYCSEKGQPHPIPPKSCKEGCVCKVNYLRNDNGTCIPAEQCPVTCGPNEVLNNCPADCESDYCPMSDEDTDEPCETPDVCPPPACKCAFNYRRAYNGSCIPTQSCPPFDCSARPNEEYNPCPPYCPTDDCSQASPTGQCPQQFGRIGIRLICNPKCRCIKDYWRLDGICVPYGQCPGVCPANERYSGCIQGECRPLNCTQKDQSIPCPRVRPEFCLKGCVCEEGYLRDRNGRCVLEDQCETRICPANERYSGCIQGECRALNCTQKDQSIPCPRVRPEFCIRGCVCEEGYLRDRNGRCVPEDQCETICRAFERYSECIQSECRPLYCTEKYEPIRCVRIDPRYCIKGCVCQEGYLKDENGRCVQENECKTCPANEEYVPCIQGVCRAMNCSQRGQDVPCPDIPTEICDSGCICKENFLRTKDGICVPEDQCEANTCPANEEWSECAQATCRAQYCTQKGKPIACPMIAYGSCIKACVCKENYLRDENGDCIPEDQCPPNTCPANEEWSECAQATCRAQDCTEKGKPIACPLIAYGSCIKACVCKENYLRDENGDCIPEDQCPPQITCGENEVLNECPSTCNFDYCPKSADEEQACVQAYPCQPACKCKFNYRRADNGTCIPTRDCPPFDCSARPNEEYNPCPALCPTDECSLPRVESRCPYKIGIELQCIPKCQCMDGYGRVNGTCVPFNECPDLCSINEEYSPCVQATCRPQNCADRDDEMECCPAVAADSCVKGCVCKENYYRDDKGNCISYEECGGPLCPYANEYYTKTMKKCPPNTCIALVAKFACDENQPEEPGCLCMPGYLRLDENSQCVPICDCPQMANSPDC